MATASSAIAAESNGVEDWLSELAAGQGQLERVLDDAFERLGALSAELDDRQRAWETDRARRQGQLQARTAECSRREAELHAEWDRLQEAVKAQRAESAATLEASEERISRAIAELRQERELLQKILADANAQVSQWSEAAAGLAKARDELLRQAKDWSSLQAIQAPAQPAEPTRALEERVRSREKDLAGLEQERAALERELEIVRSRAAELSEMLAQQGRQGDEERARWSDELRQMRRLLETVAQRQLAAPSAAPGPPAATVPAPSGADDAPDDETQGDPMLDSVISQFEILQRDLSRRRKAAAG